MGNSIEEDIVYVNNNNFNDFIAKYGKITDSDTAKRLLTITTNAWLVLDDSLKHDSDIIMYLQPMGIGSDPVYDESNGVKEEIARHTYLQKDFMTLLDYITLRLSRRFPKELSHYGFIQFPDISVPEDFDFVTYAKIQDDLSRKSRPIKNAGPGWVFGDFDPSPALQGIKFVYFSDFWREYFEKPSFLFEYDRSTLPELVAKYSNQVKL